MEIETGLNPPSIEKKGEIRETKELRQHAAQYLENSGESRTFIQTLKSFAGWVSDQLAKLR